MNFWHFLGILIIQLICHRQASSEESNIASNATIMQNIEVYRLDAFPFDSVSMHMPCKESNMFATKCMCHIKCLDPSCGNARKICAKYSSEGCKYMLTRGQSAWWKLEQQKMESKKIVDKKRPLLRDLLKLGESKSESVMTSIAQPYSSDYCGSARRDFNSSSEADKWKQAFLNRGIALVALNYHSPKTLANTVRTWNTSGLLSMVTEKIIILNDPLPQERAISVEHGLTILEPKNIPNVMTNKPNVITIGQAFYHAMVTVQSEYVLFLENDFKIDTALSVQEIASQLLAAAALLDRGIEIIRLVSRKYQGCGTFKSCSHGGIDLKTMNVMDRKRNWYAFYCKKHKGSEKYVADCMSSPDYRCFTSWDSNWTLNAVMVKKSTMLGKKYPTADGVGYKSIAEIGKDCFASQDGFESTMGWDHKWMRWKVPICISYDGLFLHEEIETRA